jgi:hypothetical protein
MNAAMVNFPKLFGPQQRQLLETLFCMASIAYCYAFRFAMALL